MVPGMMIHGKSVAVNAKAGAVAVGGCAVSARLGAPPCHQFATFLALYDGSGVQLWLKVLDADGCSDYAQAGSPVTYPSIAIYPKTGAVAVGTIKKFNGEDIKVPAPMAHVTLCASTGALLLRVLSAIPLNIFGLVWCHCCTINFPLVTGKWKSTAEFARFSRCGNQVYHFDVDGVIVDGTSSAKITKMASKLTERDDYL